MAVTRRKSKVRYVNHPHRRARQVARRSFLDAVADWVEGSNPRIERATAYIIGAIVLYYLAHVVFWVVR